jgi:hypothetical protein
VLSEAKMAPVARGGRSRGIGCTGAKLGECAIGIGPAQPTSKLMTPADSIRVFFIG